MFRGSVLFFIINAVGHTTLARSAATEATALPLPLLVIKYIHIRKKFTISSEPKSTTTTAKKLKKIVIFS